MSGENALYQTVSRSRVYEQVMDQITTLILENRLQPGDQLPPERELAQKLGVGRNAVREAVKALQERGLLEVIQGAGTFVKHMDSDVISDSLALYIKTNMQYIQLMDLREILDVEIAGRLAANVDKVDLTALWDSLERMQQLIGSADEFAKEDVRFHIEFYRATKNEIILLVMQPVMNLLEEAVAASFQEPGSDASSLAGHRKMIERISAGDEEGARSSAAQIISRGRSRLLTNV